LFLRDADERDVARPPAASDELFVDAAQQTPVSFAGARETAVRSAAVGATSVRGPGRVAQYASPMTPMAIIGNA
jgi:hypothetical protein